MIKVWVLLSVSATKVLMVKSNLLLIESDVNDVNDVLMLLKACGIAVSRPTVLMLIGIESFDVNRWFELCFCHFGIVLKVPRNIRDGIVVANKLFIGFRFTASHNFEFGWGTKTFDGNRRKLSFCGLHLNRFLWHSQIPNTLNPDLFWQWRKHGKEKKKTLSHWDKKGTANLHANWRLAKAGKKCSTWGR